MTIYAHAQAPVRIGIAGGGTDLPAWTREHVGRCLSLAIKAYTHSVVIARPDGQVVASYRKRDVSTAATEIANGLIRESALLHGWEDGFEVHTLSELSSRGSGLGVSSSIAVTLAACFQRMALMRAGIVKEMRWLDGGEPAQRMQTARNAWTVEINKLRRPIGRQDHMAAAHGGLRLYSFAGDDSEVAHTFSKEDADWVAEHLLLVQLTDGHDARAILAKVIEPDALKVASESVVDGLRAIEERDPRLLGQALNQGQESKRMIKGAVPMWLEEILQKIQASPEVLGCKVAGAGGGGHIVVACESTKNGAAEAIEVITRLPTVKVQADTVGLRSDGWL